MGGLEIGEELGAPGTFYAKNITPAGVGNWTDGELFRAITEGVNKDGEPLFPMMPYLEYGKMDKEDIYSIIAYMRTLKPIQKEVPKSKANFPMSLIMRTMPVKSEFKTKPNGLDKIASGKYLVESAGCMHCHTPNDKGEYDMNMLMAGGNEMIMPGNNILRSSNITPDTESGIGLWTKEIFIKRFKAALEPTFKNTNVKQDEFNTIMPWTVYAGMSEGDLGNIYEYLKSLKPVRNQVEKFTVKKY
jgi:hypothetical protein